ncbi:sulfurtransferase [Kyrpidia spormannii]|uniref:Putative 3-mercaptopyruvate sulfurtransferase n=1 Tax=Kyrpidia spormannii TaxID=2055160 RepID=A0A6F9EDJ2_9BACL|nr:sulfurtransferase [Kyrpidia spormannii]CAB3394949.1 putative 3-mercaptopyruvate sulfurtransferase [Kyrpidia spormannii]
MSTGSLNGGPLVSVQWLKERIGSPDVAVIDCRFTLNEPDAGEARYREGHIPGAVYLHLERDLCGPKGQGGRHPLADPDRLARVFSKAGIGAGTVVVAYDDQTGEFAARLWWTLRYLGHEQVRVLDGGYAEWQKAGHPVTLEIPTPSPASFVPRVRPEMMVDAEYVSRVVSGQAPGALLIDSRAPERYTGEQETIDPVGGHIPGAVNIYWKDGVDEDGRWKSPEEQRRRFSGVTGERELIVYCGSGVTACANLLALEIAGISGARVYVGSWSEWCADPGRPVARGPKP